MHTWAFGRRRGAHGVGLFGGGSFIPWPACGGSHGLCVHGHTSCVFFMVFHGFPVFSCGALRLGGLFPLMLSHILTSLVSWLGTIKVCFVERNKTPFASCDEVFPLQKEIDWPNKKNRYIDQGWLI